MRQVISFNDRWNFYKPGEDAVQVSLPHTWNGEDGQRGGEYLRTTCIYEKSFSLEEVLRNGFDYLNCPEKRDPLCSNPAKSPCSYKKILGGSDEMNASFSNSTSAGSLAVTSEFFQNHQVWISFEGVNASAEVSVNDEVVCRHDGGYSRFRANITDALHTEDFSHINEIKVKVNNGVNRRVYPQKADFTFYGGIYRDVHLLIVPSRHIALGEYGSEGVWIKSHILRYFTDGSANADLEIHVKVDNDKKLNNEKRIEEKKATQRECLQDRQNISIDNLQIPTVRILEAQKPNAESDTLYDDQKAETDNLYEDRNDKTDTLYEDRKVKADTLYKDQKPAQNFLCNEKQDAGKAKADFLCDEKKDICKAKADFLCNDTKDFSKAEPKLQKSFIERTKIERSKIERTKEQPEGTNHEGCLHAAFDRDNSSEDELVFRAHFDHARLWNGRKDPYLYKAVVTLGEDEVEIPFGIREVKITKDGFFLNGSKYPLHGVSRHQDRPGIGNAITREMHKEDFRLILEMGANAVRLAHYQHAQEFYDVCDRYGLVVWAEIPYISEDMGNADADENTRSQMSELILQNRNHTSISMWGISNEITISTRDKKSMLENHRYLNDLVHKLDPSRPTVLACYAMCGYFNPAAHLTDAVGWNLYLGWYVPGKWLNDLWVNFFHFFYPDRPLCFSEYGAEGMPGLHSAHPRRGDQSEEYQASYHAWMLRFFDRHPWMWGSFAWTMYDFASSIRDEGGDPGKNHKGLVTFDRQTRKDAFYVYKAFWSQDPFVHIASKRFQHRAERRITIHVYSNLPEITLYLNGERWAAQRDQKNTHEFVFKNVPFTYKKNKPISMKTKTRRGKKLASGASRVSNRDSKPAGQEAKFSGSGHNSDGRGNDKGRLLRVEAVGKDRRGGTVSDEAVFIYWEQPDASYRLQKGKSSNWV